MRSTELLISKLHLLNHNSSPQDWIVQCLTSPPTQYRLYGRRFLQIKRPNQQYQSTEGSYKRQIKQLRKLHCEPADRQPV